MLAKPHRINTSAEYELIFKRGRKFISKYFILYTLHNPSAPIKTDILPKFGIIASKKVGQAVIRNRAKRLIREVIKAELPLLKKDFAAVIVAFASAAESELTELQLEAKKTFTQAGLYRA